MYGAGKQQLESQYGTAKENIMANLPQGGALLSSLAGADIAKAGDLANVSSGITQDMFNKAYGAAFGAPGQAMQGMAVIERTLAIGAVLVEGGFDKVIKP